MFSKEEDGNRSHGQGHVFYQRSQLLPLRQESRDRKGISFSDLVEGQGRKLRGLFSLRSLRQGLG